MYIGINKKNGGRFVVRWIVFLIFTLPFLFVLFMPIPEHLSRLIASVGFYAGISACLLWITVNPNYITPPRQLHTTEEKYKKAKKQAQVLRVILLCFVAWFLSCKTLPLCIAVYNYLTTKLVVKVEGNVSSRATSLYGTYFFHQIIKLTDQDNVSHRYELNYSLTRIEPNDCITFYALPRTGVILSFQRRAATGCAYAYKVQKMKDHTW